MALRVVAGKCPRVIQQLCQTSVAGVISQQRWKSYKPAHKKKIHAKDDAKMEWAEPLIEYLKKRQEGEAEKSPPHMLHVVWRVQPLNGRPWWEKDIIKEYELDGPMHQPVVLKNIPSVNKRLWEVKHLLKILPLKFPHGMPEHPSDFEHTIIKSNGEMIVKKRLKQFEPEVDEDKQERSTKWDLHPDTVKKVLRRRKEQHTLHTEFHKTYEKYRFNQDGKEYRYNFNKNTPKFRF